MMPANEAGAGARGQELWLTCSAKTCCYRRLVDLSGADLWRIASTLELPAGSFACYYESSEGMDGSFILDDSGRRFRLALAKRLRERGELPPPCIFLVRTRTGDHRCGLEDLRPAECRGFPITLVNGGPAVREDTGCVCHEWTLPDVDQTTVLAAEESRADAERYGELVSAWNERVGGSGQNYGFEDFCRYLLEAYGGTDGYRLTASLPGGPADDAPAQAEPLTAADLVSPGTIDPEHPAPPDMREALLRLDLRLRWAADEALRRDTARPEGGVPTALLAAQQVEALLAGAPGDSAADRLLKGTAGELAPRLGYLSRLYSLTPLEEEAILICLAPDADPGYERLFGYLQDGVAQRPTAGLILQLLCPSGADLAAGRAALTSPGVLLREGLVMQDDGARGALSRGLRLDERVAEFLLGSDAIDPRLRKYTRLFGPESPEPEEEAAAAILPEDLRDGLLRLLTSGEVAPIIYLHGTPAAAKEATLRGLAALANRALLEVELPVLLAEHGDASEALRGVIREAHFQGAILALNGFDRLLEDAPESLSVRHQLGKLLTEHPLGTVLMGQPRWEPSLWLPDAACLRVELPAPRAGVRASLWRSLDGLLPAEEADKLASQFRLGPEAIQGVISSAFTKAAWRGDAEPTGDDVWEAARGLSSPPLEDLARRLEPRYGWEDLILAPDPLGQLREVCGRIRHQALVLDEWGYGEKHARRGSVTVLFSGPPGTGKSMAAEVMARDLGLELFRIDLASVVSKYIGETEKNLERIFSAADRGDAVLLFDEADAIFGKRSEVKEAHDRYANVEIAYLLQRLETYEGLAILTTNMSGNIDEAFLRRFAAVVTFAMPDEAERLAIWRLALPARAPLAEDVDLAFLARKFKLAGGNIRNIALSAAFLAADGDETISMKHLVRATRREYQKMGKLVGEGDFERYYGLLKGR